VTKAGVKAFTEALQHELRNTAGTSLKRASSDPGFCLHRPHGQRPNRETGRSWTPVQTIDFMIERIDAGDFTSCVRIMMCREASMNAGILWAAGRHRREPARAVALASGLCGGLCGVCEGSIGRRMARIKAHSEREQK